MLPMLRRLTNAARRLPALGARGITGLRAVVVPWTVAWLAVVAVGCGPGSTDPAAVAAYAGTYVLVSIDGQSLPARLPTPSPNGCTPTVLEGSATVTPTVANRDPLYTVLVEANPLIPPAPPACLNGDYALFDVVRDVGVWSQASGGLRFSSDLGAGGYTAAVGGSAARPELTMSVRGHALVFVRVQPYNGLWGGVVAAVVDATGADVAQAVVTCQQGDLVVARHLIFQGPFQAGVPLAPTAVSVALPPGYRFAAGQTSQVSVEPSATTPVVMVRFVAERTGG